MAVKFVFIIAFVAVTLARPDAPLRGYGPPPQQHHQGPAKYNFDWGVSDDKSGNHYGQQEKRNGYNTEGSYYVLLPDGRTQKVTYTVNGDSGFVADVIYEGSARHEQSSDYRPPSQTYQPQPPAYVPRPRQTYN